MTATAQKRPYFGGGRKPTGVLIRNKTGYSARFWADVDGVRLRITKPLGTDNKRAAARKLQLLLTSDDPVKFDAAAAETFAAVAERVHQDRLAAGIASAKDEYSRLKSFAIPELGRMLVTEIKTRHINAALDNVREAGRSKQTAQHVKQAISNVLAAVEREGAIEYNPADKAELPTYARSMKKTRAVLTNAELLRYLAFEHPVKAHAMAVRERQVMSCVARCFGGQRTSDLHALRWRQLNPPGFAWGFAPRQKTAKPQPLRIPPPLRPVLLDWYKRHHVKGEAPGPDDPVFPTRRDGKGGSQAGAVKKKSSHAEAFRRDLRRAFGLEVWKQTGTDRNGEPVGAWEPSKRKPTVRERDLLEGSADMLPVDFHSWRRGFRQALDGAKVDAATAQALGGWESNQDAHYLVNPDRMAEVPAEAIPASLQLPGQKSVAKSFASRKTSKSRRGGGI